MPRNRPDSFREPKTIFMRELTERVKPVKHFMISLYAVCTIWTSAAILAIFYSREMAAFMVEHF